MLNYSDYSFRSIGLVLYLLSSMLQTLTRPRIRHLKVGKNLNLANIRHSRMFANIRKYSQISDIHGTTKKFSELWNMFYVYCT